MTIEEFIRIYSGEWTLNRICPKCREVLSHPLYNFASCYIDLGVTGNEELTRACKAYQKASDELWGLIAEHKFEFKGEE